MKDSEEIKGTEVFVKYLEQMKILWYSQNTIVCHTPSGARHRPALYLGFIWHSSSKTTEIYTHITAKTSIMLAPLDEMNI